MAAPKQSSHNTEQCNEMDATGRPHAKHWHSLHSDGGWVGRLQDQTKAQHGAHRGWKTPGGTHSSLGAVLSLLW